MKLALPGCPAVCSSAAAAFFFVALSDGLLGAPVLTPNHHHYYPGEPVAVDFAGGPGSRLDWIGVYPEDIPHDGLVESTDWRYVNNTQTGTQGFTEGTVRFPNGFSETRIWSVYFLLNDGYEGAATNRFEVVDSGTPLLRPGKGFYSPGEPIQISFTNGPANAKDWIGLYRAGTTPGGANPSIVWAYVDGTQSGAEAKADGSIQFPAGLSAAGDYEAIFLENDGYTVLTREPFTVGFLTSDLPRVVSVLPGDLATNVPPSPVIQLSIKNGAASLVASSATVHVGAIRLSPVVSTNSEGLVRVTAPVTALLPAGSVQTVTVTFAHSGGETVTNITRFVVGSYTNRSLPKPLFFESFDNLSEGQLPTGWAGRSFSEVQNSDVDFGSLDSAAYAGWTTVNVDRFRGSFVIYSNPNRTTTDYQRVLNLDGFDVVNGKALSELASGRMLFGNSGYRNGASQVLYLVTRDYDLTTAADVHVVFHSLYEQNQDSFGAVEYSVDRGAHWLPAAYYLDRSDLVLDLAGNPDVTATFLTEHSDLAFFTDADGNTAGGTFAAYMGAPVESISPGFLHPLPDDNSVAGKRVEVLRLAAADHQPTVRIRYALSGTDSWYWGMDDWGLYSLPSATTSVVVTVQGRTASSLTLGWSGGRAPYTVQRNAGLTASGWTPVSTTSGNSAVVPVEAIAGFFRVVGSP